MPQRPECRPLRLTRLTVRTVGDRTGPLSPVPLKPGHPVSLPLGLFSLSIWHTPKNASPLRMVPCHHTPAREEVQVCSLLTHISYWLMLVEDTAFMVLVVPTGLCNYLPACVWYLCMLNFYIPEEGRLLKEASQHGWCRRSPMSAIACFLGNRQPMWPSIPHTSRAFSSLATHTRGQQPRGHSLDTPPHRVLCKLITCQRNGRITLEDS